MKDRANDSVPKTQLGTALYAAPEIVMWEPGQVGGVSPAVQSPAACPVCEDITICALRGQLLWIGLRYQASSPAAWQAPDRVVSCSAFSGCARQAYDHG
jgi:hypothetical protein